VILGILTLAAVITLAAVLGGNIIHRLLYVRELRHLPILTELQARENAAPLSCAVIHSNLPADHK
jgi:hypothetical protein